MVEDGASVTEGQMLAVLSNPDLALNLLARQTEVTEQVNNMRSQELALEQTRLANTRAVPEAQLVTAKARRQYEREQPPAAKGFVAGKQFADTTDRSEEHSSELQTLMRHSY